MITELSTFIAVSSLQLGRTERGEVPQGSPRYRQAIKATMPNLQTTREGSLDRHDYMFRSLEESQVIVEGLDGGLGWKDAEWHTGTTFSSPCRRLVARPEMILPPLAVSRVSALGGGLKGLKTEK